MSKVYLGGPIKDCTDEEARGWRELVKPILQRRGFEYSDPVVDRDFRGRELEPGIDVEVIEGDKEAIRDCDILLMNSPQPSYGTAMEILYGWEQGKRVYVVLSDGTIPSPWVTYHATVVAYGSVARVAESL